MPEVKDRLCPVLRELDVMQKTSSRLLALLSLLETQRAWSGEDLAERLGITSRTVRRDIDRLRELGYLIRTVKGPAGGWSPALTCHPCCSTTTSPSPCRPQPPSPPSPKTPLAPWPPCARSCRPAYDTASTCCASPPSNRPRPATPVRSTLRPWWT
ncbi:helix-turn-helix transcriptional regulator [Nonomuraea sp. bgisy101]|uniref:helix-turn-helix transcriptional regulator n=1 Tax=Nonomuraea sp. bgisy101 TaxID=3413784 RepID=UPI003D71A767